MENFDLDNRIKEGLDSLNPLLDNNEIWDNIEPHLKKKKKRRFFIWFFFGALAVMGILWLQTVDPQTDTFSTDLSSVKENKIDLMADKVKTVDVPVVQKEEDFVESKPSDINTIKEVSRDKFENKKLKGVQNPNLRLPIKQYTKSEKSLNQDIQSQDVQKAKTENDPIKSKNREVEKSILLSPKEQAQNSENPISIPKKIITERKQTPPVERDDTKIVSKPPNVEENAIIEQSEENQNIDTKVKSPAPPVKKKLTKKERENVNKKRKEERKKSKKDRIKKKKEDKEKAKKEKNKLTKPNKLPKWKYDFQLVGSGIYTFHFLDDGNQIESEYKRKRNKYVKGTEGFGTEIRFSTESPFGLILTAGIQYQQLHEKLERIETEVESELQDVTETITENNEGEIIGTTSSLQLVKKTTTYNQQLHNQYKFINIPIGAGYAFKVKKNRFRILGGIDLNTYSRFTGSLFNRNLSITKINRRTNSFFKNTVGLGIWTTVEWHKPLSERLGFVVASGLQSPLGSISRNDEGWSLSHKLLKVKLDVGINYMIGSIKKPKKRTRKG